MRIFAAGRLTKLWLKQRHVLWLLVAVVPLNLLFALDAPRIKSPAPHEVIGPAAMLCLLSAVFIGYTGTIGLDTVTKDMLASAFGSRRRLLRCQTVASLLATALIAAVLVSPYCAVIVTNGRHWSAVTVLTTFVVVPGLAAFAGLAIGRLTCPDAIVHSSIRVMVCVTAALGAAFVPGVSPVRAMLPLATQPDLARWWVWLLCAIVPLLILAAAHTLIDAGADRRGS